MLYQKIKSTRITAMKERNSIAKSILSTLLGELESNAKRKQTEVTDSMVLQACKKLIQSNEETLKIKHSEDLVTENEILTSFLPRQLSEDELTTIIQGLNASNMGQVMGHLKQNYDGKYDGKLASGIARKLIS